MILALGKLFGSLPTGISMSATLFIWEAVVNVKYATTFSRLFVFGEASDEC